MKLIMYIGPDLIEEIPLNDSKISIPGYLGSFKRGLKKKYDKLILKVSKQPEFVVIHPFPQFYKANDNFDKILVSGFPC